MLASFFLSNVSWSLFHREWVTNIYLDILDRLSALCLTWLPIGCNTAQSCLATLLKKLLHVSSALRVSQTWTRSTRATIGQQNVAVMWLAWVDGGWSPRICGFVSILMLAVFQNPQIDWSTNAQKAIHKYTGSDPQMHAAIYNALDAIHKWMPGKPVFVT